MNTSKVICLVIFVLKLTFVIAQKPNIVWITSEDNSKHYMELFDKNGVPTPHIETLAKHGIIFNNAFSNAAVCSAARSTLITSVYGPKLASHYHRTKDKIRLPENIKMFPTYLKNAGYYTANNAKEDYNFVKPTEVWDDSSRKATWKNRNEGQPFFYVHNIGITHEGSMHFSKEDMANHQTLTNKNTVFVQPNHPQSEVFKYTNAYYRDKIIEMDVEVGRIISELKKDNLLQNTFIFYYGDHGGVLPNSKGYLKEMGLHVPLVIYVPPKYKQLVDYKLGTRANGFVSFVDFGATVLNIAGIKIPKQMDGKPFLGKNIKSTDVEKRNETLGYADRFDEKYDMVRSLRKGKYKYIRNFQPFNIDGLMNNYRYRQLAYQEWKELFDKKQLTKEQRSFFEPKKVEELYDIEQDPFELKNLAKYPEYANIVKQLRKNLNKKMMKMPDLSFFIEQFLIKNAFENPLEFGKVHKKEIKKYLKVSNLALKDVSTVRKELIKSLKSDDYLERYWALIVCSSYGKKMEFLSNDIEQIMKTDSALINRFRAAEFLGIKGFLNPTESITNSLYKSENDKVALLILNSVVLLQDYYFKYQFSIDLKKINSNVKKNKLVQERLKYLKIF